MNDRARKIWREHAELLHEEHKRTVQSSWILFPTGWKWKDKVRVDTITDRLASKFQRVQTLLGEQLSDWKEERTLYIAHIKIEHHTSYSHEEETITFYEDTKAKAVERTKKRVEYLNDLWYDGQGVVSKVTVAQALPFINDKGEYETNTTGEVIIKDLAEETHQLLSKFHGI